MFSGFKPSPGRSMPEPGKFRWVSGEGEPVNKGQGTSSYINVDDEKRKRREMEKVENVLHLICWGPTTFK